MGLHSLNTNFILRVLTFVLVSFWILTSYDVALAASSGGSSTPDPIGDQLCNIVKILGSSTSKAIAIIALMSVAIGLFMGKVNWGVALTTAAGVVIMFGAGQIVGFLAGGGVDGTTCAP